MSTLFRAEHIIRPVQQLLVNVNNLTTLIKLISAYFQTLGISDSHRPSNQLRRNVNEKIPNQQKIRTIQLNIAQADLKSGIDKCYTSFP